MLNNLFMSDITNNPSLYSSLSTTFFLEKKAAEKYNRIKKENQKGLKEDKEKKKGGG